MQAAQAAQAANHYANPSYLQQHYDLLQQQQQQLQAAQIAAAHAVCLHTRLAHPNFILPESPSSPAAAVTAIHGPNVSPAAGCCSRSASDPADCFFELYFHSQTCYACMILVHFSSLPIYHWRLRWKFTVQYFMRINYPISVRILPPSKSYGRFRSQ